MSVRRGGQEDSAEKSLLGGSGKFYFLKIEWKFETRLKRVLDNAGRIYDRFWVYLDSTRTCCELFHSGMPRTNGGMVVGLKSKACREEVLILYSSARSPSKHAILQFCLIISYKFYLITL